MKDGCAQPCYNYEGIHRKLQHAGTGTCQALWLVTEGNAPPQPQISKTGNERTD